MLELKSEFAEAMSSNPVANRSFITVGYAQSLDGCLSERRGAATRISGQDSMMMTHMLRSMHSAILIGKETLQSDDPQLTVRLVDGKSPQRIVLSSSLDFNLNSKMFHDSEKMPWVATSESAPIDKKQVLREMGCRLIECFSKNNGIDLHDFAEQIYKLGIESLMIEGGAKVIESFLDARLIDLMVVTIAPTFMAQKSSVRLLTQRNVKMSEAKSKTLGEDLILWGEPDFLTEGSVHA